MNQRSFAESRYWVRSRRRPSRSRAGCCCSMGQVSRSQDGDPAGAARCWAPSRRGACGSCAAAFLAGCAGRRPSTAPPPRRARLGRQADRRRCTAGARVCDACAMRQGRRARAAGCGRNRLSPRIRQRKLQVRTQQFAGGEPAGTSRFLVDARRVGGQGTFALEAVVAELQRAAVFGDRSHDIVRHASGASASISNITVTFAPPPPHESSQMSDHPLGDATCVAPGMSGFE